MNKTTKYNIVRGRVTNNNDPFGGNRIQVRLGNIYDGNKSDNELPYCSPLLPKLIHVIPKIGEFVVVFLEKGESGNSARFYMGPILSQPQRFGYDSKANAETFVDSPNGHNTITLPKSSNAVAKNRGSVPDNDDIALIGRGNSKVTLKDDSIDIVCGYKANGSNAPVEKIMEFNKIDPAFIQMKWNEREDRTAATKDQRKYRSSIVMYADRINLVSRHTDYSIGELDNEKLISPEQMDRLLENAHPLVYGDTLVDYLKKLQTAFLTHTHAFQMLPPTNNAKNVELRGTMFDEMLSKSVKTS